MDGTVSIDTITVIIKKLYLYVVVVIKTVHQAMHHLLYYKDIEYVNHVIKHLVKIYYLFNNLRKEYIMPRTKHHKKNMTDKEWRKRKNKKIAAKRYIESPKRDRDYLIN